MIQRKQTLYLFLAAILSLACLFIPLGKQIPEGMGLPAVLYNIGIKNPQGAINFIASPLFVLLATSVLLAVYAIFQFRKRMFQAKLCLMNICIYVVWCAYFAFVVASQMMASGNFKANIGVCMPLLALIFTVMARRGVLADEKLVKSMDRIR
ncbi:DUF4293 domain-containing protein [Prevotella sp.]|uniref:DUF4293 domain-containing protein n=1 Tax=Prevotella sp. TaxID=59823 RepID=UPI002F952806